MNRTRCGERFYQIQGYLRSGDCYRIGLVQRPRMHYEGDEWQASVKLNHANRVPLSAFIRLGEDVILSSSLEHSILSENQHTQTRPIRSTLPGLEDADANREQIQRLADLPKDRTESLIVVDSMRNDIDRVAVPGSVQVPGPLVVEPFPAIHHSISTITIRLSESLYTTDPLCTALPGGSITGAPKAQAMEITGELEPQRHNARYDSTGHLSFCGNMDTNITVRTLIAANGQICCSAGGSVVVDSQEDTEYQGTLGKVNRILHQLEN